MRRKSYDGWLIEHPGEKIRGILTYDIQLHGVKLVPVRWRFVYGRFVDGTDGDSGWVEYKVRGCGHFVTKVKRELIHDTMDDALRFGGQHIRNTIDRLMEDAKKIRGKAQELRRRLSQYRNEARQERRRLKESL